MTASLIKFFIGSSILLISTQSLVHYAKKISFILKISPLIVGTTIIAMGTSLPELSFSLTAISRGDVGLAMGNVVGANITNILFVFAIGILIGKLRVGTSKTQTNSAILLLATIAFILFQVTAISPRVSGIILIALAVLVTFYEYFMGVSGRTHEDKKMFKYKHKVKISASVLFVPLLLIIGVIFGSIIAVSAIEQISQITRISTTIIGLSLVSITTTLPELLTTIFSQEEHEGKLTMGNILGSNIYNLLFIGGFINLLHGKNGIDTKNWITLILTTGIFLFILKRFSGKNIPRKYGFILLVIFAVYLATLRMG